MSALTLPPRSSVAYLNLTASPLVADPFALPSLTEASRAATQFSVADFEGSGLSLHDPDLETVVCPWCASDELHDLPTLIWCKCCEEVAWYDNGCGLTRADQVDSHAVPANL